MSDLIYKQDVLDLLRTLYDTHTIDTDDGDSYINYEDATEGIEQLPSVQPMQRGWICPVCGRGLSPFTMVCPCNNGKGWEITCKI